MTIKEVVKSGVPKQVLFYDGECLCSGIMLGRNIICGCCGGLFDVDKVIENARAYNHAAIKMFESWADVSEEIRGDISEEHKGTITLTDD